jgi:gliding motility-associated-like protein
MVLSGITTAIDNARYRVVVGSPGCTLVPSVATTITVNALSGITSNPYNILTCEGGSARFIVGAIGNSVGYQWQSGTASGWENIPGAQANELTLLHVGYNMNGYQYRVIVDAAGCAPLTSSVAGLVVNRIPVVTMAPGNTATCMDQDAGFTVLAEGTDLSYHWEENRGSEWTGITGETSASLLLRKVSPEMNGYLYRVSVSNPGCTPVITEGAQLTVNTQPGQTGCALTLLVSEGVSPNGDSQLDQWIIQGIELYPNNNVKLYNVWGDLIFERRGYNNESHAWRGESNKGLKIGQDAPDGTYYYFIDLGNDNKQMLRGFVVLKR